MSKNTKNTKYTKSIKDKKTNFLDELRHIQKNASLEDSRKLSKEEYFKNAYQDAYDFVLNGYHEKMRYSAERGNTRTYLYRWNYEKDPDSKKFKFRGVRMLDIVTKGDLIERLNTHFQKINSEFSVGWHKFKETDSSKPSRYGIYVSWDVPEEEDKEDAEVIPDAEDESDTADISVSV